MGKPSSERQVAPARFWGALEAAPAVYAATVIYVAQPLSTGLPLAVTYGNLGAGGSLAVVLAGLVWILVVGGTIAMIPTMFRGERPNASHQLPNLVGILIAFGVSAVTSYGPFVIMDGALNNVSEDRRDTAAGNQIVILTAVGVAVISGAIAVQYVRRFRNQRHST